ncbi:hypothetical protein [Falsirhodobacter sp. 20TX0035]|uniref:hypothetical protein n=1 Tax=Falsirhodobacter sp. 20TX0035 TaxID=3022019 RepID=UPI00232B9031|nr:hypothetical protein [Falsirhodobacter sp. 20TX0035]MDB6454225.1 hypothetical protein [Falsirhodobacter sp. 20TX0035]
MHRPPALTATLLFFATASLGQADINSSAINGEPLTNHNLLSLPRADILLDYTVAWMKLSSAYVNPPLSREQLKAAQSSLTSYNELPPEQKDQYAPRSLNPDTAFEKTIPFNFAFNLETLLPHPVNLLEDPSLVFQLENGRLDYVVNFFLHWPYVDGIEESSYGQIFRDLKVNEASNRKNWPERRIEVADTQTVTGLNNYIIYSDDGDLGYYIRCMPWLGNSSPPQSALHRPSYIKK